MTRPEPRPMRSTGMWVRVTRFVGLFVGFSVLACLPPLLVAWLTSDVLIAIAVGFIVSWVGLAYLTVRAGFTLSHALWFIVPGLGFAFMLWVLWELTEPGVLFNARA
jgi:hypothetical protein